MHEAVFCLNGLQIGVNVSKQTVGTIVLKKSTQHFAVDSAA